MKQNQDIALLNDVIAILAMGEALDEKYKDYELKGNWKGHRVCHVLPDWLLIYRYEVDVLVLTQASVGSHSDLI